MALPTVSNKNMRTTAILKVVGIYLITFILLLMVLFSNRKVVENNPTNEGLEKKELENQVEQLKGLIFHLDTLAALSGRLIDLNLQKKDDPAKVEVPMGETEQEIKAFAQSFYGLDISPPIEKEEKYIKNIYTQIIDARHHINGLLIRVRDTEEEAKIKIASNAEQIESESEVKESNSEDKVKALEDQIANLKRQMEKGEDSSAKLSADALNKGTALQALKKSMGDAYTKLNDVLVKMEAEIQTKKPYRKEGEIDVLYTNLNNLRLFIEGVLQN